jgi:hypothetical protein
VKYECKEKIFLHVFIEPPGKSLNLEPKERHNVWDRRFLKHLSQSCIEQFKERLNNYTGQDYSLYEVYFRVAYDNLLFLRKKVRKHYAEFLTEYYIL